MHYSDTDVNGHVNNTRYADFACDAVELDRLPENQFLTEMQIGYLAECRRGDPGPGSREPGPGLLCPRTGPERQSPL